MKDNIKDGKLKSSAANAATGETASVVGGTILNKASQGAKWLYNKASNALKKSPKTSSISATAAPKSNAAPKVTSAPKSSATTKSTAAPKSTAPKTTVASTANAATPLSTTASETASLPSYAQILTKSPAASQSIKPVTNPISVPTFSSAPTTTAPLPNTSAASTAAHSMPIPNNGFAQPISYPHQSAAQPVNGGYKPLVFSNQAQGLQFSSSAGAMMKTPLASISEDASTASTRPFYAGFVGWCRNAKVKITKTAKTATGNLPTVSKSVNVTKPSKTAESAVSLETDHVVSAKPDLYQYSSSKNTTQSKDYPCNVSSPNVEVPDPSQATGASLNFNNQKFGQDSWHKFRRNQKENINITGGRSTFDIVLAEEQLAIEMYAEIRNSTKDISLISKNLNMPEFQVRQIKEHVFFNEHQLDHGLGIRRFDPDLPIAEAWKRLENGLYNESDIQILRHEHFEARFEGIFQTNYRAAHDAANRAGRPSGLENVNTSEVKKLKGDK